MLLNKYIINVRSSAEFKQNKAEQPQRCCKPSGPLMQDRENLSYLHCKAHNACRIGNADVSVRIDIRHVEITAERIHADCIAGDKNGVRNGNVSVLVRVATEAGGQVFKIGNSAEIIEEYSSPSAYQPRKLPENVSACTRNSLFSTSTRRGLP